MLTTLANWRSSSNSPLPITKAQGIWYFVPFTITQFALHVGGMKCSKLFAACTCSSYSTWANSLSIFRWISRRKLKGSPPQILGKAQFWHNYYVHVHGAVWIHHYAPCALQIVHTCKDTYVAVKIYHSHMKKGGLCICTRENIPGPVSISSPESVLQFKCR